MLENLKQKVYEANLKLVEYKLVLFTWGNVSEIDRETGLVVIKPSGVDYDKMKPEDMVVMNLNGEKVEGNLNPSSDTPTHLELYRRFPEIGGVAHTHSTFAVSYAQAAREIPCYGTTHADFAFGAVPCTRDLTKEEIEGEYELNTGKVIAECFEANAIDYNAVPAVLVHSHGPFTWGKDAVDSVHHSVILEECAKMALYANLIKTSTHENRVPPMQQELLDKHYLRKHGANAYYGQKKK